MKIGKPTAVALICCFLLPLRLPAVRGGDLGETRQAAEKGDAQAQFLLALAYADGNGVPKDDVKALGLFRQAAAQGHAKAQYNVGISYLGGTGGAKKDPGEAFSWFSKAAAQGLGPAQDRLGLMYLRGTGTKADCQEAIRWFRRAADQGFADAQLHLAQVYFFGEGECARSYGDAAAWAGKAAAAGLPAAQNIMGNLYENGYSVKKDPAQALDWYRKAAEQGDDKAQMSLGAMYATGLGAPQDLVQAYVWLTLGAPDVIALTEVKKGMTPAQLEAGQRLVAEFRAKQREKWKPSARVPQNGLL